MTVSMSVLIWVLFLPLSVFSSV